MRLLVLVLAALLAMSLPLAAQTVLEVKPGEATATEQPPAAPQIETLPPAYEEPMLRLAEILGSLHYLRELCGAKEGAKWREEMQSLIVAEEPTETRKAMLTARFNRGFRGFQEIYRECTPSAAEAANRYLRLGARLSAEIPGRYGN